MSKIQCPKCKKYIQQDLMGQVYNCEIPKHDCVNDKQIITDEICSTLPEIATLEIIDNFDASSYDSTNDSSSSIDTSSSDIGGDGDFGGAGASSDY